MHYCGICAFDIILPGWRYLLFLCSIIWVYTHFYPKLKTKFIGETVKLLNKYMFMKMLIIRSTYIWDLLKCIISYFIKHVAEKAVYMDLYYVCICVYIIFSQKINFLRDCVIYGSIYTILLGCRYLLFLCSIYVCIYINANYIKCILWDGA